MTYQPEPTLRDLALWGWQARRWVIGGMLAGLLLALVWVSLAVPQYRITMLVGPTTRTGTPDISALFPENASYAVEYVLRSFGPGDSSDFMRFEAILRGPMIAQRLLAIPPVSQGLRREQRWAFLPAAAPENAEKLSAYLNKRIRIEAVGHTPLRKITYHHPDPAFGRQLLATLYHTTDTLIRAEVRQKAAARIAWLNQSLGTTSQPDHRRMLADLLRDQQQVNMILALDEPYAAVVAEPPAVSAKPVWPERKMLFPLLGFIGAFLGAVLAAALSRRPQPQSGPATDSWRTA
ncbi:MAG TPA: chain length determinant family protein [Micavibrio sp.]